jgi:hypothetical protein
MHFIRSYVFTSAYLLVLILFCSSVYAQSFTVSGVSDLIRVFEDGYDLPELDDKLELFGIRNEIISGQLAIQAKKDLTDLFVTATDFVDSATGKTITSGIIKWNFVGNIPLTENAPNQPADAVAREAPARFPDYLRPEKQLDVSKDRYQAVWLTLTIPESTAPGRYTGNIKVSCKEGEQTFPLHITVYPFRMPDERHLKVTEWYTTRHFQKQHGISEMYSDEWFEMLEKYADNLVSHRQNIFQVPMNSIGITKLANESLEFDFTRFDQIANVFWETGMMDYLETGELARFGEKAWFDTEIVWKDFTVSDVESDQEVTLPGEEVIPYLLPAFENHLRSMGWLDKTLFHVKDEPTLRNVPAWKEKSAIIHQYAPELVRIDAIETTFLFDEIEIAVPKLDYLAEWYDVYEKAAREGTELWFYTVGIYQASRYPNKTIDMPVIDNRILHWINYKYNLSGFLHWGWNQWYTEDPYNEVGMHIGDGWHVYPTENGVLNSLRWEQMRNGIQDYEYFWMLENKIRNLKDSLGSHFSWIDPTQRGREICSQVVYDFEHHTDDPEILYRAKKEVIAELMDLDRTPRIYVQTNPAINSGTVKERSYLVEIFGWTEVGTEITVNGEVLEPDVRGMFLRNVKVSQEENEVIIEGKGKNGNKKIFRSFEVEK